MKEEKALRSQSSRFFERYAGAEEQNAKLKLVTVVLGAVCVVQAMAVVMCLARPRAIYYIPGAVTAGVSYPGVIPTESVGAFASVWVMNWVNYTPATTETVFERSAKYMSPGFLSKARVTLLKEMERVKQDRISSVFALKKEPDVKKEGQGFVVKLEGERGVYMGKEELSFEGIQYEVALAIVPTSNINPFGLVVTGLKKSKVEQHVL
jgi:hypothetical protein